mgnify:CR=1 FL=1
MEVIIDFLRNSLITFSLFFFKELGMEMCPITPVEGFLELFLLAGKSLITYSVWGIGPQRTITI